MLISKNFLTREASYKPSYSLHGASRGAWERWSPWWGRIGRKSAPLGLVDARLLCDNCAACSAAAVSPSKAQIIIACGFALANKRHDTRALQ